MATTELAVLFPVLLVSLLLVAQATMWGHSRALARAAADYAAEAASSVEAAGDEAATGRAAAESFMAAAGDLSAARIDIVVGADTVTVTIRGESANLIGAWGVEATATLPLERYPDR